MAIDFTRKTISGSQPTIWRGEAKMLPGGFKPVQQFAAGTILQRGMPIYVDFETMSAAVCKTATVLSGGTTKLVRVAKGHVFNVGDMVTKHGDGNAHPTISQIDSTNAGYDVLSLSAAYTGLAEGDIIVETETPAEGSTAASKHTPNAVVGAVVEFKGKGLPTIDAAYEANVLYAHLPVPFLPEWVENGMCLKSNHSIKLIKQ